MITFGAVESYKTKEEKCMHWCEKPFMNGCTRQSEKWNCIYVVAEEEDILLLCMQHDVIWSFLYRFSAVSKSDGAWLCC